jgi:hypothetical protein
MFEHVEEYKSFRRSMLANTEVCLPSGGPYAFNGKTLGKYAQACTCKRPGFSPYQTACFREGGMGPVDPMLDSANSPLLAPSAVSRPSIVHE